MRKNIRTLVILIFCGIAILLIMPYVYSNAVTIRVWWALYKNEDIEKNITKLESYKKGERSIYFIDYYLAQLYKQKNIEKAIQILEDSLHIFEETEQKSFYRKNEKYVSYILLGQLYFFTNNYEQSAEYLWKALLMTPKEDVLRYDYELARHYMSQNIAVDNSAVKESFQNAIASTGQGRAITPLPLSLEKFINESKIFKLYIDDTQESQKKLW